jgi:hypothetical protein
VGAREQRQRHEEEGRGEEGRRKRRGEEEEGEEEGGRGGRRRRKGGGGGDAEEEGGREEGTRHSPIGRIPPPAWRAFVSKRKVFALSVTCARHSPPGTIILHPLMFRNLYYYIGKFRISHSNFEGLSKFNARMRR